MKGRGPLICAMLPLLSLVVALIMADRANAKPHVDKHEILRSIDQVGAVATVEGLWATGAWDVMSDHIGDGEAEWIALAPKLAPGTDGAAAEGLGIALATALPKNPIAVLSATDPKDGFVFGISRVCSIPFLEPSKAFVKRYRAQTLASVSSVHSPRLAKARHACLVVLRQPRAANPF